MEKWRARFISPRPSLWWRGWWHDLARWPHHVLAPRTRLPRSARWLSIRGTRVRSCRNPQRLISYSFPLLGVLGAQPQKFVIYHVIFLLTWLIYHVTFS